MYQDQGEDSDDEFNISHSDINSKPHFSNQKELDDLVRDMGLTKSNAQLLTSRLKDCNLLDLTCRSSLSRKRHERFLRCFSVAGSLCFCNSTFGLFEETGIKHDSREWRLFIDSSSKSLKCVFLHNRNQHPSIPIGHSVQMKEDCENVRFLRESIRYSRYNCQLCGDFKMIGFLKALQGGFTKHSCFLCLSDSRAVTKHYSRREWPERRFFIPDNQNAQHDPLVKSKNVDTPFTNKAWSCQTIFQDYESRLKYFSA